MRESHPHHFHRHHHHHHSTQTSCPGRRLTRRGSWWPWTTTRTRARARELSRLETPNITICNATVDHSDTKPFFIHYFLLCEGDLAWRLCSREVKAGWEVPPWWIRTSATINIRPNTVQVSYTLLWRRWFPKQVPYQSVRERRTDRLLGHRGSGAVQHDAPILLPPGPRMHHGLWCHAQGDSLFRCASISWFQVVSQCYMLFR